MNRRFEWDPLKNDRCDRGSCRRYPAIRALMAPTSAASQHYVFPVCFKRAVDLNVALLTGL